MINSESYNILPENTINFGESKRVDGKIHNVASFMQKLQEINISLGDNSDYSLFFRGHANKEWESKPSIYRGNLIEKEHILSNEVIALCPADFENLSTSFQRLVKMQHYSLPTRLLDITQNPLVALYFACDPYNISGQETEGEVIVYKFHNKHIYYSDAPKVNLLSSLSTAKDTFDLSDTSLFALPDFKDLLLRANHEVPFDQERYDEDIINDVLCVKPKLENPRIVKQDGAFLLFGCKKNKKCPATINNDNIFSQKNNRIIVTTEGKETIRKELELIGISLGKLFPEIDYVSKYLINKYQTSN